MLSPQNKKTSIPAKGRKYRVTTQFHRLLTKPAFSSTQATGPQYSSTVTGAPGRSHYSTCRLRGHLPEAIVHLLPPCGDSLGHSCSCTLLFIACCSVDGVSLSHASGPVNTFLEFYSIFNSHAIIYTKHFITCYIPVLMAENKKSTISGTMQRRWIESNSIIYWFPASRGHTGQRWRRHFPERLHRRYSGCCAEGTWHSFRDCGCRRCRSSRASFLYRRRNLRRP